MNLTRLKKLISKSKKQNTWQLTNKILYDLCKSYPHHADISEVTAKVFLIGRSYAAGLERRRNKDS